MGGLFSRRKPSGENLAIKAIQEAAEREARERAQREAQEAIARAEAERRAAVEAANRAAEQARIEREAALRAAQEAAERAKAAHEEALRRAREAAEKEKAEQERIARLAREEAARLKEQHEATMRASEEAAKKAKAEHEAALKKAEEEAKRAKMEQEKALRAAKEESERAKNAERDAVRKLMEGVRPEVWPTAEELRKTKKDRQYTEGKFHFAVAGVSGSGKSSLINAFRGLRNKGRAAAAVGITETTTTIARYPDPNPEHPLIWYDVPGAGTLAIPDWKYFNDQGLYIFDCIIVLFDNRFTESDIAILKNCARFKIPSFIVRSKSNQHIQNVAADMGYDEDDDELDASTRQAIFQAAREEYITATRENVRRNLQEAGLPQQKVYLVSNTSLRDVVCTKAPKDRIDEAQLVDDLLKEGLARCCPVAE